MVSIESLKKFYLFVGCVSLLTHVTLLFIPYSMATHLAGLCFASLALGVVYHYFMFKSGRLPYLDSSEVVRVFEVIASKSIGKAFQFYSFIIIAITFGDPFFGFSSGLDSFGISSSLAVVFASACGYTVYSNYCTANK